MKFQRCDYRDRCYKVLFCPVSLIGKIRKEQSEAKNKYTCISQNLKCFEFWLKIFSLANSWIKPLVN